MTGEVMSVSATINQLMSRKESYYDPDVIDTFIKVLKEDTSIEEDVVVEPPTLEKSWKNSRLLGGSQNIAMERPVMEISWTQLKPGMEIESVHFENKPYIKNCIVDQKIINNINSLRENTVTSH